MNVMRTTTLEMSSTSLKPWTKTLPQSILYHGSIWVLGF